MDIKEEKYNIIKTSTQAQTCKNRHKKAPTDTNCNKHRETNSAKRHKHSDTQTNVNNHSKNTYKRTEVHKHEHMQTQKNI